MPWPKGKTRTLTQEHKDRISASTIGRPKSAEARAAMSAAKLGRPQRKFTESDYAKSVAVRKGKPLTEAHRIKLSEIKASRVPYFTKRTIEYNGQKFRSSYEVRVAKAFDALGMSWQYESRCYRITPTQSYRPDFILDTGAVWEVKGYIDTKSREKIAMVRRMFPDVPIVVATLPVIQMLERAAMEAA